MVARGQKWVAIFLIVLGVFSIFSLLAGRNAFSLFWPVLIIFAGILLIVRPPSILPENIRMHFATEVDERGDWQVESQNYLAFANEVKLDMRSAVIPPGETTFAITGFATELSLILPPQVGLAVKTNALVTDASLFGDKQDYVFTGLEYVSADYEQAGSRLRFELNGFAVELNVIN
ncbi:MAG: cell wall-active antibiotics response protein [Anaerolineae bacterium]|nr:cell wall-active antibiotics response protein [Anaerolineae bacterium]